MNKYVFISPCKVLEVGQDGFMEEVSPKTITPEFVGTVNDACADSLVNSPNLVSCMWREQVQGRISGINLEFFVKDDKLMLRTEVDSNVEMLPEQIEAIKLCLAGQYSDGWGEGFEQRPITHNGRVYFVSTWFYGETKWELQQVPRFTA